MSNIRRTILGASLGIGIGITSTPEKAEAREFATTQSPDPDFPFESLAESEDFTDIIELLNHLNNWAYRENAADIANDLAKKHPLIFIHHSQQLLNSEVPWAHDALLTALQSDGVTDNAYGLFKNLDVNDSRVATLLEESMEQRYGEIIEQFWDLPEGKILST